MALSSVVIAEKNKIHNADSEFLYAIGITIPGTAEPARVVLNTEDITWRGETWTAMPFSIEGLNATSTGEVPQVTLKVSNVNHVFEKYVQDWDTYCKNNGYAAIDVTLYELNTADLANAEPCTSFWFTLKQPSLDSNWATFVLSASNPANRRAPYNIIQKNYCSYRFRGDRCGYAGTATTCDHHITTCRALGNSKRFGGCPGAGKTGLTLTANV